MKPDRDPDTPDPGVWWRGRMKETTPTPDSLVGWRAAWPCGLYW
jgi:hypothetical protein